MNWSQLRPLLNKTKYGFYYYNDANPKTGNRRIKICSYQNQNEIFNYIKTIAPELDVKLYKSDSVVIHYKNI